jgi:hypothetical protein
MTKRISAVFLNKAYEHIFEAIPNYANCSKKYD